MADIAAVLHWPLCDLAELDLTDLAYWWSKARARAPGEQPDE